MGVNSCEEIMTRMRIKFEQVRGSTIEAFWKFPIERSYYIHRMNSFLYKHIFLLCKVYDPNYRFGFPRNIRFQRNLCLLKRAPSFFYSKFTFEGEWAQWTQSSQFSHGRLVYSRILYFKGRFECYFNQGFLSLHSSQISDSNM